MFERAKNLNKLLGLGIYLFNVFDFCKKYVINIHLNYDNLQQSIKQRLLIIIILYIRWNMWVFKFYSELDISINLVTGENQYSLHPKITS